MCSRQVRTRDERGAVRVGQDLLGLVDVDDDLRPDRHDGPERRDRRRRPVDGLDRVALLDPPVVAAVEQPDVVDAGVAHDHQRPRRRDLAGPATRPLLVGLALGVAAVDDDRRVAGDAERLERGRDRLGRAAVPVGRVLEPVGVEVVRARDVALGVLLGDAEVDVEQQELLVRRRLGSLAGEHVAQPRDVDELCRTWGAARAAATDRPPRHARRRRASARTRRRGCGSSRRPPRRRRHRRRRRRCRCPSVTPLVARRRSISASSTVSSQTAGKATAPGTWPPRASPLRRQPL